MFDRAYILRLQKHPVNKHPANTAILRKKGTLDMKAEYRIWTLKKGPSLEPTKLACSPYYIRLCLEMLFAVMYLHIISVSIAAVPGPSHLARDPEQLYRV